MLKAAQIRNYADVNDAKSFYKALRGIYWPSRLSLHPVRSIDGALIRNKVVILTICARCLQSLLDKVHATEASFLNDLPTLPTIQNLDDPPSFDEMETAILSL